MPAARGRGAPKLCCERRGAGVGGKAGTRDRSARRDRYGVVKVRMVPLLLPPADVAHAW